MQDNLLYAADFSSGASNLRLYDSLNRITHLNTLLPGSGINPQNKYLRQQFTYENISGQRTSPMVTIHTVSIDLNSTAQNLFSDSYNYDDNGNITTVIQIKGTQAKTTRYQYDGLNQLVRVNDEKSDTTTLYTYDAGGNITSVKTYPHTTGEVSGSPLSQKTYTYASSGWKDLLTNFNGDSIIYDEIGNPTQYRDDMDMTWSAGRQLASVTQGTNSYSFSYDASGTRISKTVNGTTYDYIYDNGQLIYADTPSGSMTFIYENDSVVGYKHGTEYYYYIKNLQGDIIGVIDKNCNLLYQYEYDAWGNHTVLDAQNNVISPDASHIANANPLRYRGYFFDTETGLYYLLSRYYDPETGRFVNADNPEILFEEQDNLLQYNLFAYCFNNPINMTDSTGESPAHIIGGILGGVTGAALGKLLADALGLKGFKRWALIAAATVGGAVLGAFLGPYVAKLGSSVAAKLGIKTATKAAFKSIGKITVQKMKHINTSKHLWGKVLKKVTNKGIENLIQQAIKKGSWETLKGGVSKITYHYGGEIITVTGKIINNVFNISDAWVNR